VAGWSRSYLGTKVAIAIDGPSGEGRGIHGEELSGAHLLVAYAHGLDMVLG